MTAATQPSDVILAERRVLLVEDMLLIADEVSRLLEALGCVVVGPVPKLDRAIVAARQEDFDIALLDVNLDGQWVFPVTEVLNERGMPFVFMTGYGSDTLPPEYRDYLRLEKPFSPDLLADRLRQAMTEAPTE